MEPTRCKASQLMSSVVTWRNPGTEDLSSLSKMDRVRYNGRVFATEVVLLPLVLTVALIESIAYFLLAICTIFLIPFSVRPFRVTSDLYWSSIFTVSWDITLLWRNLTQNHLINHEAFARIDVTAGAAHWDHLRYVYTSTANDLREHPAFNHPRSPEVQLRIDSDIFTVIEPLDEEYIFGIKPVGAALAAFEEDVRLVLQYKKAILGKKLKSRPSVNQKEWYRQTLVASLQATLKRLSENDGDPNEIAKIKELLAQHSKS